MDLPSVTAGELATTNHPVGKCLQDEPGGSWGGGLGSGPMGHREVVGASAEVRLLCSVPGLPVVT